MRNIAFNGFILPYSKLLLKFWDGADLRLGAIDTTNVNRKERERKRQLEKSQSNSNITSILKR